jgi:hypothetical protein
VEVADVTENCSLQLDHRIFPAYSAEMFETISRLVICQHLNIMFCDDIRL